MSSIWSENLSTSSPGMVVAREMKMTPMMIEAQLNNEKVPKYYAAAMSSLIGLFIVSHLLRYSFRRYATPMFKNSTIIRYQVIISRFLRSIAIRRVPGFTSAGHALVVLIYIVVNLALTFTNINWSTRIGVAKRCGWMALTNICFITILALKNTPLGFLTGYSYERLNYLHQIGGYTTITFVILHLGIMTDYFLKKDLADLLLENAQIAGITAASAMLTMGISAILVRKLRYEAFYIIHILMFMLLIINIAIHRPDFTLKTVYITIITGCIWSTDRLIRISRMIWNSYNDRAIIQPLPNGGTRIILHHSTSRILPGSHCLIWIPKARAFETHPFTVVSATSNSMELVVAARDGFTRNLHELAIRKPGSSLRASFDGPYGALPDFARSADRLMLIAGGSGASFTIGVALRVFRQLEVTSRKRIDFIWAVKTREMLSWYSNEIAELQSSPLINLIIHTTGPSSSTEPTSTISPSTSLEPLKLQLQLSRISTEISEVQVDVEKNVPATPIDEPISSLCILPGRPDAATLIRNAVGNVAEHERIAIVACGPDGLMRVVRETVASCITVAGPSVELHCEQFSW